MPQAPLAGSSRALALSLIGLVLAACAALFAYAAGWFAPHALSPALMIDTFEQVNGLHPGFRRNHAKGVCFNGHFESNGRGTAFSRAAVFQTGRVPLIGRFALAGGQPGAADAPHTVRSMAVLFKLSNGEEWRTGMNNIPVFPVNTARAFHDQLLASAPDPATGRPDPARMSAFLASHPESAKALQLIRANPVSTGFENSTYNSLNAFRFINSLGDVRHVRWAMVPVQPFQAINPTNATPDGTNYLFNALIMSLRNHPLQWRLIITLGHPEDPTADATLPWPPDREQVEVGILTVEHIESEDTSPARDINFDPLVLPDGIAPSDDPLLSARSAAYSKSFTRREGEPKDPSAVGSLETGR